MHPAVRLHPATVHTTVRLHPAVHITVHYCALVCLLYSTLLYWSHCTPLRRNPHRCASSHFSLHLSPLAFISSLIISLHPSSPHPTPLHTISLHFGMVLGLRRSRRLNRGWQRCQRSPRRRRQGRQLRSMGSSRRGALARAALLKRMCILERCTYLATRERWRNCWRRSRRRAELAIL